MKIPVFLFLGLLESGKTAFISQMLKKSVFADGNKTVVISCEEGIEEYDTKTLEKNKIIVINVEDEDDFNDKLIEKIKKEHNPQRILIEYNGMWDLAKPFEMELPDKWFIYQVITLVNAETYNLYINNMRSIMVSQFSCCDLTIVNRMKDENSIAGIRGVIKSINPTARIFSADEEFVLEPLKEELPYDINSDIIDISKDNYGVWYIDIWENAKIYSGKIVKVKGLFFQTPQDKSNCFSFGRYSMPCCSEDIALMGVYCHYTNKPKFNNKDSVELEAEIKYEKEDVYEGDLGPVLYVKSIKKTDENQEDMVVFN